MAAMQFWGVEVKAKAPNKVTLDEGHVIHLSQATLGELKKENDPVILHVKVGDKKFVLGVLNQTTPQLSFDLVFDQEFELSHNLKNGSVHFLGYSTEMPEEDDDMFGDDSDEEEEALPVLQKENGKPAAAAQTEAAKPKAAAKPDKDNKPKPQTKDDSDEDDSDDDEDDSDDDDSDEDMIEKSEDSDDDESEDEKPTKPESGKKRPNANAKTPETKKAKLVTPQKTDGKKGGHTATPYPSKKGGKTPPGGEKSTSKSGGQFGGKKTFNSGNALQSHKKAKHGGK